MRKQETISLFRDPLDPRELSLSHTTTGSYANNETGNPKNQFMKNETTLETAKLSQNQELPAYRITLEDGSSYVTSMAKGITLEDAKAYFLGERLTQSDEVTKLLVTKVELA